MEPLLGEVDGHANRHSLAVQRIDRHEARERGRGDVQRAGVLDARQPFLAEAARPVKRERGRRRQRQKNGPAGSRRAEFPCARQGEGREAREHGTERKILSCCTHGARACDTFRGPNVKFCAVANTAAG